MDDCLSCYWSMCRSEAPLEKDGKPLQWNYEGCQLGILPMTSEITGDSVCDIYSPGKQKVRQGIELLWGEPLEL